MSETTKAAVSGAEEVRAIAEEASVEDGVCAFRTAGRIAAIDRTARIKIPDGCGGSILRIDCSLFAELLKSAHMLPPDGNVLAVQMYQGTDDIGILAWSKEYPKHRKWSEKYFTWNFAGRVSKAARELIRTKGKKNAD